MEVAYFCYEITHLNVVRLMCNVVSVALVIDAADNATKPYYAQDSGADILGIIGLAGIFISWGASMFDAYESAKEINTILAYIEDKH